MVSLLSSYPSAGITVTNPRPTLSVDFYQPIPPNTTIRLAAYLSKTNPTPSADPGALQVHIPETHLPAIQYAAGSYNRLFSFQSAWPSLSQGLWYYEFVLDDSTPSQDDGDIGSFTVQYYPNATVSAPVGEVSIPWVAGSNNVSHTWTFGSPDPADYQSAYQLKVYLASNPATVYYDSGKVTSGSLQAYSTINAAQKGVLLEWSVEVWSKTDTKSVAPITTGRFKLTDPPTVNITAPTEGQALTSGNVSVTFTPTTIGGSTVKTLMASLWKGGVPVWSQTLTGTWTTGTSINMADANFALDNLSSYTYRVAVTDSNNLTSGDAVRNFTTNYVLPTTPSGSATVSGTNYDTLGYISLQWPGSPRDGNFYSWQIERRDNFIDPDTNTIISTGPWTVIGVSFGTTGTVEFKDYLAPSGYQSDYRIKQVGLSFGSKVVSTSSLSPAVGVGKVTGSYWLIAGINGDSATISTLKLYNIVGDTFTDETERAEFNIIGRGRYSEKGTDLGVRGQLELHLRNGEGMTARAKRQALETFKLANHRAYLRNPFGDIYMVSMGDMSVGRIPGTGPHEFCDITIPYVESVS